MIGGEGFGMTEAEFISAWSGTSPDPTCLFKNVVAQFIGQPGLINQATTRALGGLAPKPPTR